MEGQRSYYEILFRSFEVSAGYSFCPMAFVDSVETDKEAVPPDERYLPAWERMTVHAQRLAFLRRVWAHLGQFLKHVRARGNGV